jgi:polysaccharide chain length determinant protein (PEP-CTERM system associated)
MAEILAQIWSELRSAWRFRWYGAAAAWAVCLGGWAWVALQPNIYEATARVYVDASSILRPILNEQIIPTDVNLELSYVRQAVFGRGQLELMARENNLVPPGATPAQREAILNKLRNALQVNSAPATRDNSPNTIYDISYRHSNRDTAVGVVTTLVNFLVEQTMTANRADTDTAERFLEERIQEYENRLQQAEEARASFKRRNSDRLPGAEGDYFQRMQQIRTNLETAEQSLTVAEARRDQLRAQLAGEPALQVADRTDIEPPPNSIDARIRDARAQLDALLLQYTDRHPDVVALRETLSRLEAQRIAQLESLGVRTDGDQPLSGLALNPVHQALQMELHDAEVEVATLQANVRQQRERLQALQALIDEVPEVEAELARLNRDYDVVYEQYQALIRSRETQALSRKASDTDQVDFRVINPPLAEFEPVAPARLRLLTVVFLGGLMLGAGVCYLLSQVKPVFSDARVLRDITGLPLLGVVSQAAPDPSRRRMRRLAVASFAASIVFLGVLFLATVAVEVAGPGLHDLVGGAPWVASKTL